jgi:hypothetical protein
VYALAGWLSVCITTTYPVSAQEKSADPVTVCMVSLFSAPGEKELAAAIEAKASVGPEARPVRVLRLQTLGGEDGTSAALKEIGEAKPSLVVFRDAGSAAALAGEMSGPWMAIVRSKPTLMVALQKRGVESVPARVFETLPPPAGMAEAIVALRPSPSCLGIVYTPEEPTSRLFVDGLKQSLDSVKASIEIVECRLRPGACRNSKEMESALKDSSASLGKGAALLVLPESNTLKFAFVLVAFAKERGMALLGLDDFSPGQTLLHLAYSPETVADQCMLTLHERGAASAQLAGAPSDSDPLPTLYLDKERFAELSYALDGGALKHSKPVWTSAETSGPDHESKP